MKYLILSDIHGSPYYLEEVLKKETFDKILLLGDVLPHGPRNDLPYMYNPKKVIEILNNLKNKIICVKGNCDATVDSMVLEFPILDLALVHDFDQNIYMTHGHIYNKTSPLNIAEGVVLYGHFHINEIEKIKDVIYINVGSLSIPKDGHHSYGVIENGKIILKDISGQTIKEINIK